MKAYFNDRAALIITPETPDEMSLLLMWHSINYSENTPYAELTGNAGVAVMIIAEISDCGDE